MIRFKDIHIPNPCSVDYDSLPGNEVKRFCGSCEKHVYDFRGKDEAYFNSVITTHGKVCGIYHEDQIQQLHLKKIQPFYYSFAAKIIGAGLFFKTLLSSYNVEAKTPTTHQMVQVSEDSVGLKVKFRNRPYNSSNYDIDIYINDKLFKSDVNANDGFIYLPDTIKSDDKIKVIVKRTKVKMLMSRKILVYTVRPRKYNFTFNNSDTVLVQVSFKQHFSIKRKKRLAGVPVGYW